MCIRDSINNIYLLLIPVGVLIGMHTTDFREYSLTFIFYLIIVHAISGVLNKIMYISCLLYTSGDGAPAAFSQLRSVSMQMPSSAATSRLGRPCSVTIRTAPALKASS